MAKKTVKRAAPQAARKTTTPSADEIEAARTENGGWTKETLNSWGIPWPPPKGWKETLIRQKEAQTPSPQQADRLISAYTPFPHTDPKDIERITGIILKRDMAPEPSLIPEKKAKPKGANGGGNSDQSLRAIAQRKKVFIKAMAKSLSIVTKAARIAGISPRTHYLWMEQDPAYAAEINRLKDVTLDFYEDALHQLIKDKHPAAVIFALKTQGKRRGYIESANHIPVTNDDNVQFYLPDNNRDKDITDATIVP